MSSADGFCVVTRKKWLARKSLHKPRIRQISDKNYEDAPPVDVVKFLTRLDNLCTQMETSDYFTQAMSTLKDGLATLSIENDKLHRLVCFGIGPFTRNYQALHQFAFILCMQQQLNIKEALYFDPVFHEAEKEVLSRKECTLMQKNCEAKYVADTLTLFYMPHCPNALTNNLLWSNWRPQQLQNIVLINNSFESLTHSKPERLLRLDSGYILDILEHVTELPLEDEYEMPNIFNDLSVHVFPAHKLLPAEANVWAERAAPTYKDDEMVSAEEFRQLNISGVTSLDCKVSGAT